MHSRAIITIENNDCKIWHRDQVVMDLMQAIQQDNDLIVHLNNEGPCAEALGIYKLLDEICNTPLLPLIYEVAGFPKKKLSVAT